MKTKILMTLIICAGIIFVLTTALINKSNSNATQIKKAGIKGMDEITDIDGISFYINDAFLNQATAVTEISNNVNFQKNQYYVYKNGYDSFILFCMENIVIAAQKGTNFNLPNYDDKESALSDGNMMSNIWFKNGSKKFETKTDGNTTETTVIAGVAINSNSYGDYCGKLININDNGIEWSLFVGVPGERYDKLSDSSREGIEKIAHSLSLSKENKRKEDEIYAISVDGTNTSTKEEVIEETVATEVDETSLNLTNQKEVSKSSEKAYTSSPYAMLSLGDNGLITVFNDYETKYEAAIIKPKKVYKGEEAIAIIKDYCVRTNNYTYFDAPDGSKWEVLEYDLNYSACSNEDYVNIKLKGVDGNDLRYRGIKYSPKTHDITHKVTKDGAWNKKYYVYYAIPNGCDEYAIECGESIEAAGEVIYAGYYLITSR